MVDLTDREEKQANVFLNNPDAQGDWDVGMLGNLMQADGFTAEELGFTESTAVMMFDGDPRFSALFQDTEDVTATKEQIREVRDHRADSMKDMQEAQSADFLLHGRFFRIRRPRTVFSWRWACPSVSSS